MKKIFQFKVNNSKLQDPKKFNYQLDIILDRLEKTVGKYSKRNLDIACADEADILNEQHTLEISYLE